MKMKHIAYALLISMLSVCSAQSDPLSKPNQKVILTVKGDISATNNNNQAEFDLEMLHELGLTTSNVETPWTVGKTLYSGPLLRVLLEKVGARGKTLTFKALNDYEVSIPSSDAYDFDSILATRIDGRAMSVREKGPIFLVYPFDQDKSLYTEKYFARSIWQIKEIVVSP